MAFRAVVADDVGAISSMIRMWVDQEHVDLVITTGGTGTLPMVHTQVP